MDAHHCFSGALKPVVGAIGVHRALVALAFGAVAFAATQRIATCYASEPNQGPAISIDCPGGRLAANLSAIQPATHELYAVGDAALAKRPMIWYLRGGSPEELRLELAEFLRTKRGTLSWSDGATISLFATAQWKAERQADLRAKALDRSRRIRQRLITVLTIDSLDAAQQARLQKQSPELAMLAKINPTPKRILQELSPSDLDRVLGFGAVRLTCGELSEESQRMLANVFGNQSHLKSKPGRENEWFEWNGAKDLPRTPLVIRMYGEPDNPGLSLKIHDLPGNCGGWENVLRAREPEPGGKQADWARKYREKLAGERNLAAAESAKKHQADPSLTKRVTLRKWMPDPVPANPKRLHASNLSAALRQIADQSGLSMLADYDPCWDDYYSWLDPEMPGRRQEAVLKADIVEMPLWEALDAVAAQFRVTWEKRGKWIWVRSPRLDYAEIDGIDLLDTRQPPPPKAMLEVLYENYERGITPSLPRPMR